MKTKLLCLGFVIILAISAIILCGCSTEAPEITKITVEYYIGDMLYHSQSVSKASELKLPENPTSDIYTFDGWFLDNGIWESAFKISDVSASIKVYAKFIEGGNGSHTHTLQHHAAVSATCLADGNIEYWSCTKCNKFFSDENGTVEVADAILPKLSHAMTHNAANTETCAAEGNVEYWSCSKCNKNYSDVAGTEILNNIAIEKLSHSYISRVCKICGTTKPVTTTLNYKLINNGTAYEVSGIKTITDTDIVIPEFYNEFPVISIGTYAFRNCIGITSIDIPSGIQLIGSNAFNGCTGLKAVHISDMESWLEISFGDYNANPLSNAKNLYIDGNLVSEVTVPNTITTINDYVFFGCTNLTSIEIPSSVTSIGSSAFNNCTGLKEVHISNIESWLKISLESSSANPLSYAHNLYINGNIVTDIIVPDTITAINDYAFYECRCLTSIEIPSSVQSIGDYAFSTCIKLANVDFGENSQLTDIGKSAFTHCYRLTSIEIPYGVISVGSSAFRYCYELTGIKISSSVKSIGNNAFEYCYKLVEVYNLSSLKIKKRNEDYGYAGYYALNIHTSTNITSKLETTSDGYIFYSTGTDKYLLYYKGDETALTLPESYNGGSYKIYQYAFYHYPELTSVEIPSNVISIGDHAFYGRSDLAAVEFSENSKLTSISQYAFKGCTGLTSIEIPSSVTAIGALAFSECKSLTNVTFGENSKLNTIGGEAFKSCTGLTSIQIPYNVTKIGDEAFYNCTQLSKIGFEDVNNWYRTTSSSGWSNKTGGTSTNVTDASTNAKYFKSTYYNYYWYKE